MKTKFKWLFKKLPILFSILIIVFLSFGTSISSPLTRIFYSSFENGEAVWTGQQVGGTGAVLDTLGPSFQQVRSLRAHAEGNIASYAFKYWKPPVSKWAKFRMTMKVGDFRNHAPDPSFVHPVKLYSLDMAGSLYAVDIRNCPDSLKFGFLCRADADDTEKIYTAIGQLASSWHTFEAVIFFDSAAGFVKAYYDNALVRAVYGRMDTLAVDSLLVGYSGATTGDSGDIYIDEVSYDTASGPLTISEMENRGGTRLLYSSFENGSAGEWMYRQFSVAPIAVPPILDTVANPFSGQFALRCSSDVSVTANKNVAQVTMRVPRSEWAHLHFRTWINRWFKSTRQCVRMLHKGGTTMRAPFVFSIAGTAAAADTSSLTVASNDDALTGVTPAIGYFDHKEWITWDVILKHGADGGLWVYVDQESVYYVARVLDTMRVDSIQVGIGTGAGAPDDGVILFDDVSYNSMPCGPPCGYFTTENKREHNIFSFKNWIR